MPPPVEHTKPKGRKLSIERQKKNSGEAYVTPKGIQKEGKKDKPFASCNCNFNCCSNFDEDQRRNLKEAFWGLAEKTKQQEYVNRYVLKTDVKRKRSKTPTRSRTSKKKFAFDNRSSCTYLCCVLHENIKLKRIHSTKICRKKNKRRSCNRRQERRIP